jgi:hypothetical protein
LFPFVPFFIRSSTSLANRLAVIVFPLFVRAVILRASKYRLFFFGILNYHLLQFKIQDLKLFLHYLFVVLIFQFGLFLIEKKNSKRRL